MSWLTHLWARQRKWVYGLFALAALVGALALGIHLAPAPPLGQGVPTSRLILADNGQVLRLTLAWDDQFRLWTPLAEIAPSMVEALLLKEDRSFYSHPGVNPSALMRAAWSTYARGQRQGGSTLTMQLARRLYHLHTKTIGGKLHQMLLALWLEARYSKHELLEAYCNLAPMGANIEGVGAAARIYFGKPASQLNVTESLALAVMPQNPSGRFDFDPDHQQARLRLAQVWLQHHPQENALLSQLQQRTIRGRARRDLPFLAPHFCDQVLAQAQSANSQIIQTTLSPSLQRLLERLLHRYVATHRGQGINNGAMLLVDRRTMEVKVLVGSNDFFDAALHGQVNGVLAKRSPGSTLKPFIYGLAIDQGLIHPMTILRDTPSAFGAYQPENFDGRFVGPITARDALIRSRNVPAVWLASQLQHPNLYEFLQSAGVTGLRSQQYYGLALVLGGGEVSMEELVEMYGMLANDGRLRPLRYRKTDPSPPGVALLSPQAAFLVRDMLAANTRPDGRYVINNGKYHWPVSWKTGTSWGFHDAWTVGLVGDYILAVWIGNFDGQANQSFVGLKAATPLFFQVVDGLEMTLNREHPAPLQPPPGVKQVDICKESGDLPNQWCPQTIKTWFIPGKSPIRVSTLHRPVPVDTRTGLQACPPFDPEHTKLEVYAFWPSDLERLFQAAGLPRRKPPPLSPQCQSTESALPGDPPRMLSPLQNVVYTLRRSKPEESIGLSAAIDADSAHMYWFADNRYLGVNARGENFSWRPTHSGTSRLTVVDDQGRSDSRTLQVTILP